MLAAVLAIATPPFARIGAADARGDKVTAPTSRPTSCGTQRLPRSSGKFTMPPRNPYLASQAIHYYWGYFLMPATVAQLAPAPLNEISTLPEGQRPADRHAARRCHVPGGLGGGATAMGRS